jgi:hypothetical protein
VMGFCWGKPEGRRPHGRPCHRWEDNVRIEHNEMGWKGVALCHLVHDWDCWWAAGNMAMILHVP